MLGYLVPLPYTNKHRGSTTYRNIDRKHNDFQLNTVDNCLSNVISILQSVLNISQFRERTAHPTTCPSEKKLRYLTCSSAHFSKQEIATMPRSCRIVGLQGMKSFVPKYEEMNNTLKVRSFTLGYVVYCQSSNKIVKLRMKGHFYIPVSSRKINFQVYLISIGCI